MNEEDRVGHYIELWKQTIEVQKHFNDIELKIRGLGLTVLTFVLGGASLAVRDGTVIKLVGLQVDFGTVILFLGTFLWLIFYFVDQIWYHRLLIGAVIHGEELESELRKHLPKAGLSGQITKSSPYRLRIHLGRWNAWERDLHSTQKIRIFYWFVAFLLIIFAVIVQLALQPSHTTKHSQSTAIEAQPLLSSKVEPWVERRVTGAAGDAWFSYACSSAAHCVSADGVDPISGWSLRS